MNRNRKVGYCVLYWREKWNIKEKKRIWNCVKKGIVWGKWKDLYELCISQQKHGKNNDKKKESKVTCLAYYKVTCLKKDLFVVLRMFFSYSSIFMEK